MSDAHKEQAREIVAAYKNHCEARLWETRAEGWLETQIASALASRDTEVREVLEGLQDTITNCWCDSDGDSPHMPWCVAAHDLYNKLTSPSASEATVQDKEHTAKVQSVPATPSK